MEVGIPPNFIINLDLEGNDVFVATSKGLGVGIGDDYYAGLRPARPAVAGGGQ